MKVRLFAIILCVLFLSAGAPQFVSATSYTAAEAQYRTTLLALIDALTKQIAALQAELDQPQQIALSPARTDDHDDAPYRILRTYEIDQDIASVTLRNQDDDAFVNRVLALTPFRYRPYLSDISVFDGSRNESDAYVRGKKYSDGRFTWYFAVSDEFLKDDVSDAIRDQLIVHELGHIISLANALDPGVLHDCHAALASRESCPNPDSMYGQFIEEFWPNTLLDELTTHRTGFEAITVSVYKNWFVSRYASIHPAEDFAETFMVYVLGEGEEYDTPITRQKLQFMNQYATLRELKQEMLTNL